MQVCIAAVGRLKAGPDSELFQRYWKRFEASGRAVGVSRARVVELVESRAAATVDRCDDEGQRLLKSISADSFVVALDADGASSSSEHFAKSFRGWLEHHRGGIVFVIGGPDGHGQALRDRANATLSLGAMTLPHGLARVVLAEQLYRAVTILTGHPYHRA